MTDPTIEEFQNVTDGADCVYATTGDGSVAMTALTTPPIGDEVLINDSISAPHAQTECMCNNANPDSLTIKRPINHALGHESENSLSFGKKVEYHLYCPVCGHEWYSPYWDNYCPQSGCTGTPKQM